MKKIFFTAVIALACIPQLQAQQDTLIKAGYLPEVIVTGVQSATDKQKFPMAVGILNQKDLLQNSSTNIIDALSSIPGVSLINIGPAIAKPVVRGLGYNRVVVINDGIRQEGQQWGDEFGIEIDEYTVQRIEVLKGPASLRYGSDALAGVINLLPQSFVPEGRMTGRFLTNYQTNNGLLAGNFLLGGNQKGFVWNINYTYKTAHAYKNKYDGYVWNSNYGENNLKAMFGVQKKWGFSTITLSNFNLKTGIIEGARDEETGAFTKKVRNYDGTTDSAVTVTKDELLRYNNYDIIHQQVRHNKLVWDNSFALGNGRLGLKLAYQQSHRQEANDVVLGDVYNFDFLQQTINYDIGYELAETNNWKVSIGANGMDQSFKNQGTAFLFPEYHSLDIGLYSLAQKTIHQLTLSGGLRFDNRQFKGDDLFTGPHGERLSGPSADATQQFKAYASNFSGVSGSIGATYDFSSLVYAKINIARGYRAPNVAESGSNGIHDGTPFYEIGDANLKAESSLQADAVIGLHSNNFTVETTLFSNQINNYIFPIKLASALGGDSLREAAPAFKFIAGDAVLKGGEIIVNYHPQLLKWLRWENAFSFISAIQKNQNDSSKYLPYTPPGKLQTKCWFSFNNNEQSIRNIYLSIGVDHFFEQNKVFYKFNNETITPGYTLLNIGAGANIYAKKKQVVGIYLTGANLTDVAYLSNMSRLKYADINNATGRTGVYSMGRNISIKLSFPIGADK
jgi:iron complex outermembrane receptor protein